MNTQIKYKTKSFNVPYLVFFFIFVFTNKLLKIKKLKSYILHVDCHVTIGGHTICIINTSSIFFNVIPNLYTIVFEKLFNVSKKKLL